MEFRTIRSQPYETLERVRFVNALVPHLTHALQTRNELLDAAWCPIDISVAADVVRHGVIIVAHGGQVIQMNSAAEQLMLIADGLTIRGRRLQAATPSTNNELQAGIAKALVRRGTTSRIGSYLVCGRRSGRRPFVIRVLPLGTDDDPRPARATILINDTEQTPKPPKALLRKVFHLTNAESEVALLILGGNRPQAIADQTSVSVATIKTHIQRIFHKTGTHGQAELVRLLATLVP